MWTSAFVPLLLLLSVSAELRQDTEPRRLPPPGKLDFGYVPAGVYETVAHYEPGPIGILFQLVQGFLHIVQPNAFPQDLIVKLAKDKFGALQTEYQKPENIVLTLQAIYYEIGFLVCAAVGLLFAILLPVVGLFFCMCRCCDNCGGEMHQRQRKNADCRRGLLGTLLFSTSLVITIGVLCAYAANQNLSSQVKNIRRYVNSNMRDLHTFANDTPMQIDYLISQYATAKNKVIYDLNNIGPLLGGRIHDQLDKEVHAALDGALNMAAVKIDRAMKAMRETKEALENSSMGLEVLQEGTGKLGFNLSLVRTSINRTLSDPGCHDEKSDATTAQLCRNIRQSLSQLQISANFTRLPNVNSQLERMKAVLKMDLSIIVQKGFSSLNDTPHMVTEQTRSVVENVQTLMDDIGKNISSFSKIFPVQSCLSNFTIFISHVHAKIEDHYPEIDRMDFYRWIGCITLCCMVVLVLAFNYLGLLCGTLGYDKHASPTTRGCISNTGGTMLIAGVGISFIFSWVLMGLVTIIFLAGGNMEKLVCEPFHTKEVFKVVDTPYLVHPDWKNFIPGYLYNDSDMELTAESFYSTCKDNRGIYSALRLDKVFNVSSFLNITMFTKDVVARLNSVKIDLRGIILLEAEGKQNLLDFSEAGLLEINYADYLEEVNKGVTVVDLLSFARELEAQTDLMPRGGLQMALKGHAGTLRQIHSQQIIPMEQAMKYVKARSALNQSMRYLERTASDLPNKVLAVIEAIEAAQYLISHNATHLINQETAKFTATIVGYFHQYIEWVKTALAMEVAPCKPFSNMIDTVEIVTCSFLVDSMNTFWMGLGCSTLLLLPSIILAVKLAKFYRRMETEDVYDDIETVPMKTMEIDNNGYHSERSQVIPDPLMTSIPTYDTMNRFPRASAPPRHIDW
ncbi:prominin-1-A isoform X1 [Takifugu rubripes]|uniref:prominin-1-A isoform X1 n=1 Tax=Takifugu rubripes TaxID=31033 RepID=UPI00114524F0|nr:prominin-1a isoform X1 [Takifugu rubripes]XP_029702686.1 prominin-1a isoform X1 [Takifugu rubripes]XP_029702687.1 prominin-1a isoform X1 [Takifugu rubripes]